MLSEPSIYEAKADREAEAKYGRTLSKRLPAVIGCAVFTGGLAWGLIALFGVTAFLVIVAAFAGTLTIALVMPHAEQYCHSRRASH
jgi:hypothetical protein